jgi:hypothetical protein
MIEKLLNFRLRRRLRAHHNDLSPVRKGRNPENASGFDERESGIFRIVEKQAEYFISYSHGRRYGIAGILAASPSRGIHRISRHRRCHPPRNPQFRFPPECPKPEDPSPHCFRAVRLFLPRLSLTDPPAYSRCNSKLDVGPGFSPDKVPSGGQDLPKILACPG